MSNYSQILQKFLKNTKSRHVVHPYVPSPPTRQELALPPPSQPGGEERPPRRGRRRRRAAGRMFARDPWGGPLEISNADSATDDDRSQDLDRAALMRQLDEGRGGGGGRPGGGRSRHVCARSEAGRWHVCGRPGWRRSEGGGCRFCIKRTRIRLF